jgi:hypothetical protein
MSRASCLKRAHRLATQEQTPTCPGVRRLIPVQRDEWTEEVNEALWIDEKVSVRVHKASSCFLPSEL